MFKAFDLFALILTSSSVSVLEKRYHEAAYAGGHLMAKCIMFRDISFRDQVGLMEIKPGTIKPRTSLIGGARGKDLPKDFRVIREQTIRSNSHKRTYKQNVLEATTEFSKVDKVTPCDFIRW